MNGENRPDIDLGELLDNEISCDGRSFDMSPQISCGCAADLRTMGHGCSKSPGHLCFACWQIWYKAASATLSKGKLIQCARCLRVFDELSDFADYRPF